MEGYVDGGRVRTGGEVFKKILAMVDEYLDGLRAATRKGEAVLNPSAAYLDQNRLTFEVYLDKKLQSGFFTIMQF